MSLLENWMSKFDVDETPPPEPLPDPKRKTLIDIGCGPGIYTKAFADAGFSVVGIDISPNPYVQMDIFSEEFAISSGMWVANGLYDYCLSLEVGEHLPRDKAEQYVAILTSLSHIVLFSAAQPGQGGYGHINCQPPEYWEALFNRRNYVYDPEETQKIIQFVQGDMHMGWFVNNFRVYKAYHLMYFDTIVAEETIQAKRLAAYFNR